MNHRNPARSGDPSRYVAPCLTGELLARFAAAATTTIIISPIRANDTALRRCRNKSAIGMRLATSLFRLSVRPGVSTSA